MTAGDLLELATKAAVTRPPIFFSWRVSKMDHLARLQGKDQQVQVFLQPARKIGTHDK